ncbi:hypothetical protein [Streptomyces sp. NPDC086989]|uniref:hypothetical protein n=1 Tax=Streptomyces sp. NPDC086989 TaxID=3365764 RepID=UPI003811920C
MPEPGYADTPASRTQEDGGVVLCTERCGSGHQQTETETCGIEVGEAAVAPGLAR